MNISEKNKYKAYSILRKYITFEIVEGEEAIELKAREVLFSKLKLISGRNLLDEVILNILNVNFHVGYQRFFFKRIYDYSELDISLYPYGFIINLGYLSYYNKPNILIKEEEEIESIIEISKAIYYIKNIKRFYYPAQLFNTTSLSTLGEDISKDIENAYFAFFPQYSVEYIEIIFLNNLEELYINCGKEIEFEILKEIIQILKKEDKIYDIQVDLKKLYSKFYKKISKKYFYEFIDLFSYSQDKCTEEKFEFSHLNYLFIKEKENYKIKLLPMNIIGLYRQAYVFLTHENKKTSQHIGKKIEELVSKLVQSKQIKVYNGYWMNTEKVDPWYETDLILNLEKTIVLIEVKKGDMKFLSKNGSIFNSLLDVKKSFLDSQLQALRLREKLEREKKVKLYSKKNISSQIDEIELNNKTIITLSLTLEDYDLLHCKSVCANILKYSLFIDKIITEPPQKEIDATNNVIRELKDLNDKFKSISNSSVDDNGIDIDRRYHKVLFLNIQYLYYLLKNNDALGVEDKLNELCCILRNEDIFQN
ncbi:MAG: hypothetical protein ACRC4T_17235 [Cetobacterium sp.]